jgi:hypothetical protein
MPASYSIDPMRRLVSGRAWGVMTNEDLRAYYRDLVADPHFVPSFRQLMNLDDVTEFAVKPWTIAEVAAWPAYEAGARRAVVAHSDVAFGMARMFSMHAERARQNIRVFRTVHEAEEWLDSPVAHGELETSHVFRDARSDIIY